MFSEGRRGTEVKDARGRKRRLDDRSWDGNDCYIPPVAPAEVFHGWEQSPGNMRLCAPLVHENQYSKKENVVPVNNRLERV